MSETVDDDIDPINGKWISVQSAFSWDGSALKDPSSILARAKTLFSGGGTAASAGVTAASIGVTQSIAIGGATIVGTAVCANPIGLAISGGVLMAASVVTNSLSVYSTTKHVLHLKKIRDNPGTFAQCVCMAASVPADMALDHKVIQTHVLPYIIRQKTEKAVRKGIGIVPGGGLLTTIYRAGRAAFKSNRGKARGYYANVLARHLVTHDCALAGAIVAELFTPSEMVVMRMFDSDQVGNVVKTKMKSI